MNQKIVKEILYYNNIFQIQVHIFLIILWYLKYILNYYKVMVTHFLWKIKYKFLKTFQLLKVISVKLIIIKPWSHNFLLKVKYKLILEDFSIIEIP